MKKIALFLVRLPSFGIGSISPAIPQQQELLIGILLRDNVFSLSTADKSMASVLYVGYANASTSAYATEEVVLLMATDLDQEDRGCPYAASSTIQSVN